MATKIPKKPNKRAEFEEFIEILKRKGQAAHWIEIAEALGVGKETIIAWKKHPEAIKARREGIAKTLAEMQKVGAKDWRMHVEKLKMLGINPSSNVDLTTGGEKVNIALVEFMNTDGNSQDTRKTS